MIRGSASAVPEREGDGAGVAIRVLLVDDHPVVRHGLRAMLNVPGMEVVAEAGNGAEAIAQAREHRPDVVLMDLRMPETDGLAATRMIRNELPKTEVIVLTSFETKDHLRMAIDAGATGYLVKGVSREVLVQAVRSAKEGGSLVDPQLLRELASDAEDSGGGRGDALPDNPLGTLSPRETQVLRLLAGGLTNKEIAREMHYSVGTVKNVVQRIIEKLGVSDRTQAAVFAVRAGLDVE